MCNLSLQSTCTHLRTVPLPHAHDIFKLNPGQNAGGQNAGQNCMGRQNAGQLCGRVDKMTVSENF